MIARTGSAIERVAHNHYGPFWIGTYRAERDFQLAFAKSCESWTVREHYIQLAKSSHRAMMRCLREVRREDGNRDAARQEKP